MLYYCCLAILKIKSKRSAYDSGFSPSRKLGYSVATGSVLFSLENAWVSTVPAGIGVNFVHVNGGDSHQVVCQLGHFQ